MIYAGRVWQPTPGDARSFDLVVVVGSLGGLESAAALLGGLPGDFPVPIILLQHGPRRNRSDGLADILQRSSSLPIHPVDQDEAVAVRQGVTVLPYGWTATLDSGCRLQLAPAARGSGGDTSLCSASEVFGARLIGVVLTGMLRDGTEGVRAVKRRGGRVLVEDPRTARAGAMPASALATGCVDFALPNTRLAAALMALALAPGGADLFRVPTPAWASLGA
jgi:two-component system chemotaxis response regulator CheB